MPRDGDGDGWLVNPALIIIGGETEKREVKNVDEDTHVGRNTKHTVQWRGY